MNKNFEIDKLGKKSFQAAIFSGLGGIIVLLALFYSFYQLNLLEEKKSKIEQKLSEKQKIIDLKQKEIDLINVEFKEKQNALNEFNIQFKEKLEELSKISKDLLQKQTTLDYISLQLASEKTNTESIILAKKALIADEASATTATKPRIYIQVRDKSQLKKIEKISNSFKDNGYLVPKIEVLTDIGPKDTEIRYFRESEREKVDNILSILNNTGSVPVKIKYIAGHEDSGLVKPMQFEIWFNGNF